MAARGGNIVAFLSYTLGLIPRRKHVQDTRTLLCQLFHPAVGKEEIFL